MTRRLALAPLLCFALCAACSTPEEDPIPTDFAAVIAPRPYTAEQIRFANPPGTVVVHRLVQMGKPTVLTSVSFLADDGTSVTMEKSGSSEEGVALGAPTRSTATWVELRNHATFAAETTQRTEETVAVEAGQFECWVYTVQERDGTTSRFCFAKSRPGPPVLYEVRQGRLVVMRMEMIAG